MLNSEEHFHHNENQQRYRLVHTQQRQFLKPTNIIIISYACDINKVDFFFVVLFFQVLCQPSNQISFICGVKRSSYLSFIINQFTSIHNILGLFVDIHLLSLDEHFIRTFIKYCIHYLILIDALQCGLHNSQ